MTKVPAKRITVRADDDLTADLAYLAACGLSTSEAVRRAVSALAWTARHGHRRGLTPLSEMPRIHSVNITPTCQPAHSVSTPTETFPRVAATVETGTVTRPGILSYAQVS